MKIVGYTRREQFLLVTLVVLSFVMYMKSGGTEHQYGMISFIAIIINSYIEKYTEKP